MTIPMDLQPALKDAPSPGDEPLTNTHAALRVAQQSLADLRGDINQLLDASGVLGLVVDPQMRILRFTPNVTLMVGLTSHDMGRPLGNALAHLNGCDDLMRAVQSVLDMCVPENREVQSTSGQWWEVRIRPHHLSGRPQHGAALTFVDISTLKQTQMLLLASEARYQTLVDWSPEAINILRHGVFIYVNPVAVKAYGATSAQALLGTFSRDRVHPDDLPAALERLAHVTRHRADAPRVEMRFLRLDGAVMDVETQATSIDYEGEPAIHVAWRDITRQKSVEAQQLHNQARIQMADEVLHLAFHDELTKLPNRRVLNDRMRQAMLSSKRSACFGALMFLDLDNFKHLNDTCGHAVGDMLLMEVARRLKNCVRETDTVARFGGDEFLVMLSQLSTDRAASIQQALGLAEKIRLSLAQPHQMTVQGEGTSAVSMAHVCTSSIGLALFINDETSHNDVLKWADTAMYQAKKAGRNRVHLHEPVVGAA